MAYQGPSGPNGPVGPRWDAGKPSGPGSGTVLAIIGLIVAFLVAATVAVTAAGFRAHNANIRGTAVAASSTSSVVDPSSVPGSSPGTSSPDTAAPGDAECPAASRGPNTPAGWKTVSGKRGLAYDVPADWDVLSCGTLIGWEKKCDDGPFGYCPIRTMSGAATLESPRCPKSTLADAGLPGASDTTDITEAVRAETGLVADIYTSDSGHVPSVRLSTPRRFTIGGMPAVQIVAAVSGIEPSGCQGTTALHSMVATTVAGQPGSVLFIVSLPQGVPGAVTPAVGDKIVSTLRRAA